MKATILAAMVLGLTLALGGTAGAARPGELVRNYDNVPVTRADNAALTSERVRQAIVGALQRTKWMVVEDAPGRVVAAFSIRGKHSLTVEIRYSGTEFSINYKDSFNLNYGQGPGGLVIHPAYNKLVKGLLDAITAGLQSV